MSRSLLLISLICSLIGLFLIIFLADNIEPKIIPINDINEKNLDEYVRIQGTITELRETESLTIITAKDETGTIKIVSYEKVLLMKSQKIEVLGKVTEYNGELEIEATKIKLL